MQKHHFDAFIPEIYEAAFSDELWPAIAKRLSHLLKGSAVGIDSHSGLVAQDSFTAASLFDTSLRELHYEGYDTPEKNPGVAALMRARVGSPFDMRSFIDSQTYERDPSIQAILRPQSIDKGVFVTLGRDPTGFEFMSVFRRVGQDEFDTDHHQAVEYIGMHIARAIKLRRFHLTRQRSTIAAQFRANHDVELEGLLIANCRGLIIQADPGPEAILALNDALSVRNGYLYSRLRREGQDQKSLLSFLEQHGSCMIFTTDASITSIELLPSNAIFQHPMGQRYKALHIRRNPIRAQRSVEGFAMAFSLSRAEARIIEALMESDSATQAAEKLQLSRETVKTHLSRIYDKTDVRSLNRLMLLVGRFL